MSGGMNWERAKRDKAKARDKAEQTRPLARDRGKPVTQAQRDYIAGLAKRLGVPVTTPKTAYQASLEIESLKRRLEYKKREAARQREQEAT